ncbi:ABC transporter G family member 23-like [Brevipalpus obovatus]|uniref:ABC transporter G family member 23-like n=1 Tax=Brevipalpus obovatus TaxID=246614 RepID=UPI003D9ED944
MIAQPVITVDSSFETSFSDISKVKLAVRARNVCLTYGSGAKTNYVLNNLSISVPSGSIYGLLGPSGCGKTSILKIVSGLMKPDSGVVRIFGYKPGLPGSGVPGAGIGYMPQDIALQSDLTVEEMLSYFGRLYFMPISHLRSQIEGLVKLLEIPDPKRMVKDMSGGQQRRLSLACAIIHRPRLAILDEPTVGVDPMLCNRIWELLGELSTKHGMTIIITTHYIEECRKAQVVSFMRKGEILEEGPPNSLIERFNATTLEDVFYQICLKQKRRNTLIASVPKNGIDVHRRLKEHRESLVIESNDDRYDLKEPLEDHRLKNPINAFIVSINVLVWRYLLQAIREPVFLLILFLFPFVSLGVLFMCIGHTPRDLPVAWVVEEEPQYGVLHARPENFSIAYSNYLTPFYPEVLKENLDRKIIDLRNYSSLDAAIADMKALKVDATIYLKRGFSDGFHERINMFNMKDLDEVTIDQGTIHLYGDMTNRFVMVTVELSIKLALLKLMNTTAIASDSRPELRRLPFELGEPVYGNLYQGESFGLQDYAAPGFMISIIYGCSMGLSALAMSKEQSDKMFDRNFATGISVLQMMVAQTIARSTYLSANSLFILLICVFIFKIPCEGSFLVAYSLLLLQTLSGQMTGIFLGATFPAIENLVFIAVGSLMYVIFTGGIFWPLDALPYYFRWLSLSLPFTMPAISLRSILIKKGAPFVSMVLPGFVMSIGWATFFFIAAYIVFKIKYTS